MMRVVIDTNIIVSAYLGGTLERIIVALKAGDFVLVVSNAIANEYLQVLRRPKFKIESDELDNFAALLLKKSEFVFPQETLDIIKADPTDNKFLEAALAGEANAVVSGDNQMLDLKSYRKIPIIAAREFVALLESQK